MRHYCDEFRCGNFRFLVGVMGCLSWMEKRLVLGDMCLRGCVSVKQQSVRRKEYIGRDCRARKEAHNRYNIISELKQIYSMTKEMFVIEFCLVVLEEKFFALFLYLKLNKNFS